MVFFWLCARGSKGGVEDICLYSRASLCLAKLLHDLDLVGYLNVSDLGD